MPGLPAAPDETPTSRTRFAALLCYTPWGIGLLASLWHVSRRRPAGYLHFHARQGLLAQSAALLFLILLFVLAMSAGTLSSDVAFVTALVALGLVSLLLAVFSRLMWRAYGLQDFRLPLLGLWARRWSDLHMARTRQ